MHVAYIQFVNNGNNGQQSVSFSDEWDVLAGERLANNKRGMKKKCEHENYFPILLS